MFSKLLNGYKRNWLELVKHINMIKKKQQTKKNKFYKIKYVNTKYYNLITLNINLER